MFPLVDVIMIRMTKVTFFEYLIVDIPWYMTSHYNGKHHGDHFERLVVKCVFLSRRSFSKMAAIQDGRHRAISANSMNDKIT